QYSLTHLYMASTYTYCYHPFSLLLAHASTIRLHSSVTYEIMDFDTVSPHNCSTMFVTFRVEPPLPTISIMAPPNAWSQRLYFSNSSVENSPLLVRGTFSLMAPTFKT